MGSKHYQYSETIYDSRPQKQRPWLTSSKSAVIAEYTLSFISLAIYGRTAHFAATHGYYHPSAKISSSAKLMYAGALLHIVTFLSNYTIYAGLFWTHVRHYGLDEDANEVEPSDRIGYFFLAFMLFPWIASWLFWAGYLRLAGTIYCPPNLVTQAALWVTGSAVGFFFGAGF